jgi:dipeptidyl aminopeptidase/acylaminoacyl peptidase
MASVLQIGGTFEANMIGFRISHTLITFALVIGPSLVAQVVRPLTDFDQWIVGAPSLSPEGKTLAFEWEKPGLSERIFLRPFSGGRAISFASIDDKDGHPTNPSWSPDGKQLAFLRDYCASCNHELFVKGYPDGHERQLGEVCWSRPSWTPDSRFLVASQPIGNDNEECRAVLIPADGSRRINLVAAESDLAAVSQDGKRLAYAAGNQLKLAGPTADLHVAETPVTLAKEPHAIWSINWVPDGHAIFYQVVADGNYYSRLVMTEGAPSPRTVNLHGNIEIA